MIDNLIICVLEGFKKNQFKKINWLINIVLSVFSLIINILLLLLVSIEMPFIF